MPLRPRSCGLPQPARFWVGSVCFSAYTELPERSSHKLVMTIQSLIEPQTELFTIGQYRETLSPYLQRTLTLVEFEGELAFGISQEPGPRSTARHFWRVGTLRRTLWSSYSSAPGHLAQPGLQGRVIGGDNQTLVVSRL